MDKNRLKEISGSLKFEVNNEVVSQIESIYIELEKNISKLKKINTDGVVPMTRVNNNPINFLREDIIGSHLPKEVILKNAPKTLGDFVAVNNEVSNDK